MKQTSTNPQNVFAHLYKMYARDVTRFFMSYSVNMMDAEDMAHDLFLKLLTSCSVNMETAKSLVFIAARRMLVDKARHDAYTRRSRLEMARLREAVEMPNIEVRIDHDYIRNMEQKRLQSMSEAKAQAYRLCHLDNIPLSDVAEMLGENPRTVESRLYSARREMREYIKRVI